jgi:hypothetical protein
MPTIPAPTPNTRIQAAFWLAAFAALGVALARLFPDSCWQDGGYHFLFARWAWVHPQLFVGVWARPLFTTLYSFPALIGYPAAKLFTLAVTLLTAWQTWRFAEDLKLERAPLTIPFFFLQPSLFIICTDTMTEPIFALVLIIALRLHHHRLVAASMMVTSLLILARPEGFFVALLWGVWVLSDPRDPRSWRQRLPSTLLLAAGSLLWWVAALLITGDPLFILHNWPASWPVTGTIYGAGAWWSYVIRLPEIVGPFLIPPFLVGLWRLSRRSEFRGVTIAFLFFFALHTVLRRYGLLGSAGYPRYFAAISPAIAIITLGGWNHLAAKSIHLNRALRTCATTTVLLLSGVICFGYFDGAEWIRDAKAAAEMQTWFAANQQPVRRLIWSQAYMCILFDRDPWENLTFTRDRDRDLAALRDLPDETLVFWERRFGPKWHGLNAADFEEAGYELLHRRDFILKGYMLPRSLFGYGGPRHQEMFLFYKPGSGR